MSLANQSRRKAIGRWFSSIGRWFKNAFKFKSKKGGSKQKGENGSSVGRTKLSVLHASGTWNREKQLFEHPTIFGSNNKESVIPEGKIVYISCDQTTSSKNNLGDLVTDLHSCIIRSIGSFIILNNKILPSVRDVRVYFMSAILRQLREMRHAFPVQPRSVIAMFFAGPETDPGKQ